MAYIEADFKRELRDALRASGCVCELIPDLARAVVKPYDMVAGIHGRYVGAECKLTKVGTSSSPGRWRDGQIVVRYVDVRTNQHTALRETARRGSVALIVAALYDRHDHDRYAFAWSYEQFLARDVWTLADCRREATHLLWRPGKGWDVEGLTGMVRLAFMER